MAGTTVLNRFEQTGTDDNPLVLGGTIKQADGTQAAAIPDATGGATVDAEARTAINDLLAVMRNTGFIAT
jgi:hypothetical protein